MDLAQIGLAGVARHSGAVLYGLAQMRVTFDTVASHEPITGNVELAQCVRRAMGNCDNHPRIESGLLYESLHCSRPQSDQIGSTGDWDKIADTGFPMEVFAENSRAGGSTIVAACL